MDEPFIEKRESTVGANVIYMIQTATGYATSWKRDENRSLFLGSLLARGSVMAQQSVDPRVHMKEVNEQIFKVQPILNTHITEESSSTLEDVKSTPSYSAAATEESRHMSQEEKQLVLFGEKEFQAAKALTEEQVLAIKSLQDNPDEVEKQNDLIHICVCDRGGQQYYLPIHTTLIANCSEFIPKTYLLVFNLTKSLSDFATATFRIRQGVRKIAYTPLRRMKNEEIIGGWATAVDLAHPKMNPCKPEAQHKSFLGQHHVIRGPPMFIVGTHYDQIDAQSEEGQQLLKEQEVSVEKMLSQHEYIERVIPVDNQTNEIIFKVDNTRSGTTNPDPVVNTLKKLIFDMAMAYRDDASPTPLPYVVLELGLLNVSFPDGPSSACDSKRKIVAISDIFRLAQQYCDIEEESQCKTALRYLSSVGAIFYFFKAALLRDKIFTDPQWLFDVMSTFVTIYNKDNISVQLRHDLKELKEEGRLSRRLAEHLLQTRPQLGVKPESYNTIFTLLQLVDIFCPALSHPISSIEDTTVFYVPCMLEVDYEKKTAWELSEMDNAHQPPSLIFKADNVDAFPESLFFRLSSRTAYQFPQSPQLKRNRILVHCDFCDMELELLYHPSCKYVIATTFPVCDDDLPSTEIINKQCFYVRRFLCWHLDDAKRNGMDGFQYKMYFQDKKKSCTMDVDDKSLFLLPNCNQMPKIITNPTTKERLGKARCLTIKPYYTSSDPQYELPHEEKNNTERGVTDAQLYLVADIARDKWWQIGVHLGLKKEELVEYEETKSLHYRLFCLLADWTRKTENPTINNVVAACQQAGVGGAVKEILHLQN